MQIELIARPELLTLPGWAVEPAAHQMKGTPGERLIEAAGRVCYDSLGKKKSRRSVDYHAHILDVQHGSVAEHANYTFWIRGVSRGLTHEFVRHRVGVAISQRSTRFCDENETPWMRHPLIQEFLGDDDPHLASTRTAVEVHLADTCQTARATYRLLALNLADWLKNRGVDRFTARKQARAAARGYLGNALETELIWTANIRTILHVVDMRAAAPADAEIRELGVRLVGIMKIEAPAYFDHIRIEDAPDGSPGRIATNVRTL